MIKKTLSYGAYLFLIVAFTGCAYDSASLDYAKKHKLSEELYSDVKIECVTTHDISKDEAYILDIITETRVVELEKQCKRDYKKNKKGKYPQMASTWYKACVGLIDASTVKFSYIKNKNGRNLFDVNTVNLYKTKKLGSWGYEKPNNDNILFFKNGSTNSVGKAMSTYVKKKNLTCKNKTHEIEQSKIDAKNKKAMIAVLNKLTFADNLNTKLQLGIGYYYNAAGTTIDSSTYDPSYIFAVKAGLLNLVGPLGFYLEMSMPVAKEENGQVDPYLQYQQYGLGVNYILFNNISLFTGLGYSKAIGTYTDTDMVVQESTGGATLYTTVGMTYLFDTFFYADVSYQSIGGIGFGLGYKFGN